VDHGSRQEWPTTLGAIYSEFRGFRYSFWALFGWFSVLGARSDSIDHRPADPRRCAGFACNLYRSSLCPPFGRAQGRASQQALPVILLLALWFVLVLVGLVRWTLLTPASQGRLMFPALVSIAFVLIVGWAELVPIVGVGLLHRLSGRVGRVAALCPILIIAPTYAEPQRYHSWPS